MCGMYRYTTGYLDFSLIFSYFLLFCLTHLLPDNCYEFRSNGFIDLTKYSKSDFCQHSTTPQEYYSNNNDISVYLSVLIKDNSLENQLNFQYNYYRSDQLLPYFDFNEKKSDNKLYKIVSTDQPLGPRPVFVSYNVDIE